MYTRFWGVFVRINTIGNREYFGDSLVFRFCLFIYYTCSPECYSVFDSFVCKFLMDSNSIGSINISSHIFISFLIVIDLIIQYNTSNRSWINFFNKSSRFVPNMSAISKKMVEMTLKSVWYFREKIKWLTQIIVCKRHVKDVSWSILGIFYL